MAIHLETDATAPWRSKLGRRLLVVTAILTALVYLPISIVTGTGAVRVVLFTAGVVIVVALATVSRSSNDRLRSVVVVATFVFIGIVGLMTVGSLSGPGVGSAAAVVFCGLLLGRRAMYVSVAVVAVSAGAIAVSMVTGLIPSPDPATVDFGDSGPWIRSSMITLTLVVILASAMVGVVETLEQATARTEAEIERRRDLERVIARSEGVQAAGRLAAGLAHDIRNQLAAVRTWNDIEPEGEIPRRAIDRAVDHALTLTNRLLVLGGPSDELAASSSVAAVLEANVDLLRFLGSREIGLDVAAEDAAWCSLDERQVGQLIVNLVSNACEAIDGPGRVTVRARTALETGGAGTSGAIVRADWVQIEVSDDGRGMTQETAARSVDPYFSTKRVGEGSGLGLSTVLFIVESAGGAVTIDTRPASGTTVTIWLPARHGPERLEDRVQGSPESVDWSG